MKHARLSSVAAILSLAFVSVVSLTRPGLAVAQQNLAASPTTSGVNGQNNGVAYDDKHNVYLQVFEASRQTWGRFIDAEGNIVVNNFLIGTNALTYALQPSVAYSRGNAGVDVFLVAYVTDAHRADAGASIYGQMVRFTTSGSPLVGGPIPISPNSTAQNAFQVPTDIAYNPVSQRFLVAYDDRNIGDAVVRTVLPNGSMPDQPVNLSNGPGGQGGTSLAFDWERNRYFAIFIGDNPSNPAALGAFGYILDGNSAAPVSQKIDVAAGFTIETAAVFLPERDGFLALFMAFTPGRDVIGRFVPSSQSGPTLPEPAYGVIANPNLNEGGPSGAYDYVSRKTFVVSMRDPKFIGGNTLNGLGQPELAGYNISTSIPVNGSFFPITTAAANARFGFGYLTDYNTTWFERVQFAAAGTPGPSFVDGPCTCPPVGELTLQVDTPSEGQTVQSPFVIAGWSIDTRAPSSNGSDTVHIYAISHANGAATFVGVAPTGGARPDVGSAYGAKHTNSGWGISLANVPPGMYTLVFYPHSAVTNNFEFDKVKTRVVNIQGTVLTKITSPDWGNTFAGNGNGMTINGWAIDMGNPNGTGIDTIHIWAIDAFSGAATFLGVPTMGITSQEAAAMGGDFRFLPGGFSLQNTVPLPQSTYYLLVYSHTFGSSIFNVARVVGVHIIN